MPQNWKTYKLGEIAVIKYGKDHKKLEEGFYPCYGTGGIMRYVDKYLFNEESVLIPRKGSLNNIYYINEPFWTVDTLFWTKVNSEKIIPKYLYYNFKTIDFASKDVGSAVPSLTTSLLNEIEVCIPQISEQKAIASILSALDDKIELNLQQNKTLEEMAMALYKHWFVDFGPFQDGNFVESELGMIPEGWEVKRIGEITKVVSKGTTPRKKDVDGLSLTIPFLKVKDISNDGLINQSKLELIPKTVHEKQLKRSKLKENDILFSIAGTIGRVSIIPSSLENSNCNQALAFIRLKERYKNLIQVYFYFKSVEVQSKINSSIVQGVQANVSLTVLKNLNIIIPKSNLTEKFNLEISPIFSLIRSNRIENQTLTKLRDTLLPKLISGDVRVKDLEKTFTEML